jgi:hypothetical protein
MYALDLAVLFFFVLFPALSSSGGGFSHSVYSNINNAIETQPCEASTSVDEQLYSRQLLVYGKSAQRKMQESHVLVLGDRYEMLTILTNFRKLKA